MTPGAVARARARPPTPGNSEGSEMTTTPVAPPDGDADRENRAAGRRLTEIVRSVLGALGRPPDFLKATVRPVSGDNFRVNVVTGPDVTSARIAYSYFVTADDAGTVTGSKPPIVRCH